jgi:SAM-dependent methyltransferase
MSNFSSLWLRIREPVDHEARYDFSPDLFDDNMPHEEIVDLGCGTGSNFRYLAPRLGRGQNWLCVDHDAELLEQLVPATATANAFSEITRNDGGFTFSGKNSDGSVQTLELDLASKLATLAIGPDTLLTGSALLDLVSRDWLQQLVTQCCSQHTPALFALTYDGRIAMHPTHPDDEMIRQLVNSHQETDKGFGPALGPGACAASKELFEAQGYSVEMQDSDWQLLPQQASLQKALLNGWVEAALEVDHTRQEALVRWSEQRLEEIGRQALHITVGHKDFLALPPRRHR